MGFVAKWKDTNERLAAVAICDMVGISQGAFTRIALLKEIARISALGQAKPEEVTTNGRTTEEASFSLVSGEAECESASGDMVADPQATDNQA